MADDYTDVTSVIDASSVTDTSQTVGYGAAAAAALVHPPVTQTLPSPIPLIRSLRVIDIQSGTVEPESSLFAVDLRFQEAAGIYCELISQGELEEFALASGSPLNIQYIAVFNEAGERVRELNYKIYSENSYIATWDGRGADGFFVPAGKYHARARVGVDYYYYEALSSEIGVTGDPYTISVVFTPKNDEDLEDTAKDANPRYHLGIRSDGQRLMRDCWVEVFRGGRPDSGDKVSMAKKIEKINGKVTKPPFEGHMEATKLGRFSTPKRVYIGQYGIHKPKKRCPGYWCRHSSVEFGDDASLRINLMLAQPSTGNTYKRLVEIHRGNYLWTTLPLSGGCPTISPVASKNTVPYGEGLIVGNRIIQNFGILKNRQTSDNFLEENGKDFLTCVYGRFTVEETNNKLQIWVELKPPMPGSAYDKLHRNVVVVGQHAVEWLEVETPMLHLLCNVRIANTVLRRVPLDKWFGEDLVVKVDKNSVEFVPFLRPSEQKDIPLTKENHISSFLGNKNIYDIVVWGESLQDGLEYANKPGHSLSLVLKARFAWKMKGLGWCEGLQDEDKTLYLPPEDAAGKRWDTSELEFEFPIPSPIQEA